LAQEEALPFENTGSDYLRQLKQYPYTTDKESIPGVNKVWVYPFTCLVVRAIHLDVVEGMSAD